MDTNDDSGLLSEYIFLGGEQVKESELKDVSFHCCDCEQWGLVHNDEIPDCHKGHDVRVISTLHGRDGPWVEYRTEPVDVD